MRRFSGNGSRLWLQQTSEAVCERFDHAHIIAVFDSPWVAAAQRRACSCMRITMCRNGNFNQKWLKNASLFLLQRGTTPHTLARARRWRSSAARASWSTWYGRTMAGSPSRYATSMGTPSGASTACRPNRSACWTTSKYRTRRVCTYLFLWLTSFDLPWTLWSPFPARNAASRAG